MPTVPAAEVRQAISLFNWFLSINTTASLKHESFLKSLGATHVINHFLPDTEVLKAVAALAPALSYTSLAAYEKCNANDYVLLPMTPVERLRKISTT
ncbi:hypothetical protein C8R44DRAFT_890630 [Mycena epipterygia]|nr:hypothetical protein C8R44DRAFT_890630 [Mycena epipterygia]